VFGVQPQMGYGGSIRITFLGIEPNKMYVRGYLTHFQSSLLQLLKILKLSINVLLQNCDTL